MTFDPNTIEHLGVKMYSTIPPVLAELIANSYDANATVSHVQLNDEGETFEIVVSDDGHGMSRTDIRQKFLKIGRNRRDGGDDTENNRRKPIGKKGLGKLSFFGIADEIEVTTFKEGLRNTFVMKWHDIINTEDANYEPDVLAADVEAKGEKDGTSITLRNLRRKSDFNAQDLAVSLSKMFIVDGDFSIQVQRNKEESIVVKNEMKYEGLTKQVEWNVPGDVAFESDYEKAAEITGYLIAAETPISPRTNMRGITLFSRGKLVNKPEYFSESTSSHFFSYITGELHVDFVDDLDEDVINTDRQSLNWGHPAMVDLRSHLTKMMNWLERDWREKRRAAREAMLTEKLERTGMKIAEWQAHVPPEVNAKLTPVLEAVVGTAEFSETEVTSVLEQLRDLVPPYTYYHYSNLHPVLSAKVFDAYKNQDYYNAVAQGVIKYIREMQKRSTSGLTDLDLIKHVFSPDRVVPPAVQPAPELSVTAGFLRPDGSAFEQQTTTNITMGHGLLARAMWQAFRNPIHHELAADLRDSGLYSEQDCLDALGLLSHLFRRLDSAV